MRIESVDLFYLREPSVRDIADGSQDALIVRVSSEGHEGWGECEASPLTTLASWCAPMSHAACRPVQDALRGFDLRGPEDIRELNRNVRAGSLDLLQAPHMLSGLDSALWDLLGRAFDASVSELLGARETFPKRPYASILFGSNPEETERRGRECQAMGFNAVKFGWGPFGLDSVESDTQHLEAARAGIGDEATLLIDAGTVWRDDVEAAATRLPALQEFGVYWLEEPFVSGALSAYSTLGQRSPMIRLAAGEGATDHHMVEQLVRYGEISVVQIDAGRIGGPTTARDVALMARQRGVEYVNHTFTSNLALAASLAPYWDDPSSDLCEYPVHLSTLAEELTVERVKPDQDGRIAPPEGPGLGVRPDLEAIRRYLVDAEITVNGRVLYRTPSVD